jgi:hypothetical protein
MARATPPQAPNAGAYAFASFLCVVEMELTDAVPVVVEVEVVVARAVAVAAPGPDPELEPEPIVCVGLFTLVLDWKRNDVALSGMSDICTLLCAERTVLDWPHNMFEFGVTALGIPVDITSIFEVDVLSWSAVASAISKFSKSATMYTFLKKLSPRVNESVSLD